MVVAKRKIYILVNFLKVIMKLYQNILATGALILSIGLSGCEEQKPIKLEPLEGIVKEEFGEVARLVNSSGAMFGNDSVKIGDAQYGLLIESKGKTYSIVIYDTWGDKPLLALAKAIELGDKVKIYRDNHGILL